MTTKSAGHSAVRVVGLRPIPAATDYPASACFSVEKLGFHGNAVSDNPPVGAEMVRDVGRSHREFRSHGVEASGVRVAFYQEKGFEMRDPDESELWFAEPTGNLPTEREE